jgi:L-ascorbate metabolism protein UlaG (beta-lactamase superfamily)
VGFEDLLRKRLGPMRELVRRPQRIETPTFDPSALWYRRAVGLELRIRPEETWAQLEVIRDGQRFTTLPRALAEVVLGMTDWIHAERASIDPKKLWKLVEQELLFFSTTEPDVKLVGATGVLARKGQRLARRASMWPTAAVETAIQVAPMPFMPRGRDLAGAELVGVRFASLERGHEVLGVTLTGSKALGLATRELLSLLDGSRTEEEILSEVSDRERARKLLEVFDLITALDDAPVARMSQASQVTWLGHAAVLVQTAGKNLLVDPLFFSSSDPPARGEDVPFDPRTLPKIDAILITHGDNDHLNANSLAMLPPSTPIYLPRVGNEPAPYQVDLFGVARVLGFERIVELEAGDEVRIGSVMVTACPFAGESWGLDLAKLTYLVESDEASLFFAADSNEMPDVYRALAERQRPIDLAFMGISGNAETYVMPLGFGYGNFYADWVPRIRHREWVRHCAGPKEAQASLQIFKPRWAFGYAAGGASYIRTEYSDTGDHETLARLLGDGETKPATLQIGVPVSLDRFTSS